MPEFLSVCIFVRRDGFTFLSIIRRAARCMCTCIQVQDSKHSSSIAGKQQQRVLRTRFVLCEGGEGFASRALRVVDYNMVM